MSNTITVILIASGIASLALVGLYILDVANKHINSESEHWNDLHH